MPPGKRGVDQRDRRTIEGVAGREVAAVENPQAEGVEIAVRDGLDGRSGPGDLIRIGEAVDLVGSCRSE